MVKKAIYLHFIFLILGGVISSNVSASSPLIEAIQVNDYEAVKKLLESGISVNHSVSQYDKTKPFDHSRPIHFAVENFDTSILEILIEKGADVNATIPSPLNGEPEDTALAIAIKRKNLKAVKILLEAGAVQNIYNKKQIVGNIIDKSIIALSCVDYGDPEAHLLVDLLLKHGADNLSKALLEAVENKNYSCIKMLLSAGANPNIKGDRFLEHDVPIIFNADADGLSYLLAAGAEVNTRVPSKDGCTFIFFANAQQTKLLLEYGATVNLQNKRKMTPLHYAMERHFYLAARFAQPISYDSAQKVILLLQAGANMDVVDDSDTTAREFMELNEKNIKPVIADCFF